MLGFSLLRIYQRLREIGLVRSQRDFARRFLGRGKTYAKDYGRGGRDMARVPDKTIRTLRSQLCAVAERVPAGIAAEIADVLWEIDQACSVADVIRRGR